MPLARQMISWPLTGGLDTKTSPLMIQPGSHLTLDNVRQERTNEWRARGGHSRSTADTLPNSVPPLMVGPLQKDGGLVAMIADAASTSRAQCTYRQSSAAAARWSQISPAAFVTPGIWNRRTAFAARDGADIVSATSNGISTLVAGLKSRVMMSEAERVAYSQDTATQNIGNIGGNQTTLRSAVATAQNVFLHAYALDNGSIVLDRMDQDGNSLGFPGVASYADGHLTNPYLDAIVYPGSTNITVVWRTNANQIHFIEFNPATGATPTDVTLAIACDNCLSLLPDPDGSGTRFVGLSSSTDTRVLRVSSAGSVLTNTQAEAVVSTQVIGSAYTAGADWSILYQTAAGIHAATRVSGVVTSGSFLADTRLKLRSNCWREAGATLPVRFILGFHSGVASDPQDTYFEVTHNFTPGADAKVQGRLLPLEAGAAPAVNACMPQITRLGAGDYMLGLVRLSRVSRAGSTSDFRYSADVFRETIMSATNLPMLNVGQPKQIGSSTYLPCAGLLEVSEGTGAMFHGTNTAPAQLTLAPGVGGSMSPGQAYQFCAVFIARNDAGDEWRSPPSIPSTVTLSSAQNQVTASLDFAGEIEPFKRVVTVEFYMTKGNGSTFQKWFSQTIINQQAKVTVSAVATMNDTTLGSGDFLYSTAAQPTGLTPAASHAEQFGGRGWLIHRDYRTQLRFSKKVQPGRVPEFNDFFSVSIFDEEGDLTNLAAMDDKLIVFKNSAIYVVSGDGPDEAGNGSSFQVTRIDSDVGSTAGTPVVSTGQEVYFVSARGIQMIDRGLQVQWVGAPVDQFLNQSLVQARETIVGAVFSAAANEVRFQTTNYRLVYDRLRNLWYRDTGAGMQNVVNTCMVGSKQALFKSDGTMWLEGDDTVTQDNGVSYTPRIRSAWIRPAGYDGRLRLYMARLLMSRQALAGAGTYTPTLNIYYDNDDTIVESYTSATGIPNGQAITRASAQPRRHRCSTFSLETVLPGGGVAVRLDAWGAEVGLRPGAFRNNSGTAERWT